MTTLYKTLLLAAVVGVLGYAVAAFADKRLAHRLRGVKVDRGAVLILGGGTVLLLFLLALSLVD